jgi:hypothetical protein
MKTHSYTWGEHLWIIEFGFLLSEEDLRENGFPERNRSDTYHYTGLNNLLLLSSDIITSLSNIYEVFQYLLFMTEN